MLRQRAWRRFAPDIWVLTVLAFLNTVGFSIGLPFISLYLYQQRGISMTLVGTVLLLSGLGSAVSQMFGGTLSDRLGRRPLMLGSMAAGVVLYLVMAALIAVSAPVVAIAVSYIAARAGLTMMRPSIQAIVADVTPKDQLTETYGLLRVGQNVGWAAGPAAGGYLVAVLPYAWLFVAAAVTSAVSFSVIFLFLKESFGGAVERVTLRSMFTVSKNHGFVWFTVLCLLMSLVMGQMSSTLSVYTVDRLGFSTIEYGLLLTLNGALVVLFQYPVALWLGHLAKPATLIAGCLLYWLGYSSFGLDTSFVFGLVSMAVITCGEIIFSPTSQAVASELSPHDWRGRYMGFFTLSETIGISVGPLLGGILLDNLSGNNLALWGAIGSVALISAFGFYRWSKAQPPVSLPSKARNP